jgi:hypothetical protein
MSLRTAIVILYKTNIVVLAALVAGCSQSLTLQVDSAVPAALMQTLPLTVAVYYDDALRNHSFTEDSKERKNWAISTGPSQVAMFDQVLASTFTNVLPITQLPNANAPTAADLVVVPTIQEMQFGTPEETFFDFYEAWIRYDISMLDPHGAPLDNWEIVTYGKANQKRFSSRSSGLNDAIALALRDAGAKLSTGVHKQPVVRRLLNEQR